MTAISIILATYNRSADLLRTLQAYEAQCTADSFEVVVVDDASMDETWEALQSYEPRRFELRCEKMERNSGQGLARNRAIPLVDSPLILFSGDDILPEPTFVEAHLTAHRRNPDEKVAILGRIQWPEDMPVNTLMAHIDGIGAEQFSFFYLKDEQEYDFRHLYTSNISLKRSVLHSLDRWFDADFTLYGFEDADLGYRLAKKGLRIKYCSAAVAYHYHYHNIYSFARRQYNSGKMACVLVQKHPELRKFMLGRKLPWKLFQARLCRRFFPVQAEVVQNLENRLLGLLSFYEYQPQPLLDSLYVKVLNYFYYKGILEGSEVIFRNGRNSSKAEMVSACYAMSQLHRIMQWYLPLAQKMQVNLPQKYDL
jgi:GT2 family glycosyltransferase